VLAIACSNPGDDDDGPCTAEPCGGEPGPLLHRVGDWDISESSWVEDEECGAETMLYAPVALEIRTVTDAGFELVVEFPDFYTMESMCTLSDGAFECQAASQSVLMAPTQIELSGVSSGSFTTEVAGQLSFAVELTCSIGCDDLSDTWPGTWPCHATWATDMAAASE
jgi:hypothetical protein